MKAQQARAMASELLWMGRPGVDEAPGNEVCRLSEHLQTLLPQMSDEWAAVEGEDSEGRAVGPAVLALSNGFVWQIGVERSEGGERCWRQITVAVFLPSEFGLMIESEVLTATNPDREQRLWRALARAKLSCAPVSSN
jgi:hypothetical protein